MPSAGQASACGFPGSTDSNSHLCGRVSRCPQRSPSVRRRLLSHALSGSSTTGVVGRPTQLDFGNLNWSGVTAQAVIIALARRLQHRKGATRSYRPEAYSLSDTHHSKHQLVVGEANLVSYDLRSEMNTASARRTERVRHLVRSVGVELDGGARVSYFVEPAPGKFRRNPSLQGVEVSDDRLRTLKVPAQTAAKIPPGGLPVEVLRYLIEIGPNIEHG